MRSINLRFAYLLNYIYSFILKQLSIRNGTIHTTRAKLLEQRERALKVISTVRITCEL